MGRLLDRLLLFLHSLLAAISLLVIWLAAFHWITYEESADVLYRFYFEKPFLYAAIAASGILLAISLRLLYLSLRSETSNSSTIDQRNELGDLRISLETVQNLSLKAASRIRGLKDIKAKVKIAEAGIEVEVRALVDGERPIPLVTEEVQRAVKNHIEEITGVPVSFVSVYVANVASSTPTFRTKLE